MADELEQLYLSTYQAVVRYLYRKVWDADRAEDRQRCAQARGGVDG